MSILKVENPGFPAVVIQYGSETCFIIVGKSIFPVPLVVCLRIIGDGNREKILEKILRIISIDTEKKSFRLPAMPRGYVPACN